MGRDWVIDEAQLSAPIQYARRSKQPDAVHEPVVGSLFPELDAQRVVNVASVPQRSPFRYPGGKTWLIPTVRAWFHGMSKNPTRLIEPFAGGAGVSLAAVMEGHVSEAILVEIDPDVNIVWKVIFGGDGPFLAEEIRNFAFAEANVRNLLASEPKSDLEHAFQTILRNRVSRGGILAPGAGLVKSGEGGRGMASRWYPETLARRIENIHEFRHRFSISCEDGLAVIKKYATDSDAAFFVDPPYPVAGRRLYRCHDLNHRQLFAILTQVKGGVLTTYNHNEAIEGLAHEYGFATRLVPMKSTHHTRKWELLISKNFDWLANDSS